MVVAFTDMQGRLQGKRIHAQFFLDSVLGHGTEGCNYLLAVDVDMNTVGGYAMSSWERGYGDMMFDLDLATLRLLPWVPGAAMVQCDLSWLDGSGAGDPVAAAGAGPPGRPGCGPGLGGAGRHRARVHRLRRHLRDGVDQGLPGPHARATSTTSTTRSSARRGSSRCCATSATGCTPRGWSSRAPKGECNLGQHEIAFKYAEVITTARQPLALQERRQGDRRAARQGADLHGQVQRAGGQLLPHPHEPARARRRDGVRRRRPARAATASCSTTSWPASRRRCPS